LQDVEFGGVVSSDLSRAYETARIIRASSKVERDARWREFAFGLWEGLTWEEIASRWPTTGDHGYTAANLYAPVGGETFKAVCDRVENALGDLQRSGNERALVVTHAGPMHAMLHLLFAHDEAAMSEMVGVRFLPGSITRVSLVGGTGQIVSLNDVSHLL
jgi:broad specificity phosphatase PhoE